MGDLSFFGSFGFCEKVWFELEKFFLRKIDYGKVNELAITVMSISGNFLLIPDGYGNLKQFNIKRQLLVKDYFKRVSSHVISIATVGPTGG